MARDTTQAQRTADRTLANIRADLIVMANVPDNAEDPDWRGACAANLRALADMVERGDLPDPFPYFRTD